MLNLKLTKDVLDRIPNLKTLCMKYRYKREDIVAGSVNHYLCNLFHLQALKSLTLKGAYLLESIIFPKSLKELVLLTCKFSWEYMSIIGSLPDLEVLLLSGSEWASTLLLSGSGERFEWAPVEGEFLQLRVLEISRCNLEHWWANEIHFPKLEKLRLGNLPFLEEIPLEIGDIKTLQTIDMCSLSESAMDSAKQIWEEQQSMGNDSLQFRVYENCFWFGAYTGLDCVSNKI